MPFQWKRNLFDSPHHTTTCGMRLLLLSNMAAPLEEFNGHVPTNLDDKNAQNADERRKFAVKGKSYFDPNRVTLECLSKAPASRISPPRKPHAPLINGKFWSGARCAKSAGSGAAGVVQCTARYSSVGYFPDSTQIHSALSV